MSLNLALVCSEVDGIVVIYYFSLVDFGRVAYDKLMQVPCYT